MKKTVPGWLLFLLLVLLAGVAGFFLAETGTFSGDSKVTAEKKIITGYGYLRGRSMTTLRNKYAGFVSKVHIYSYKPVKKGDVILEYDDHEHRTKMAEMENRINDLENELALAKTNLQLVQLDPLPSDYRNITWKTQRAKELMTRTENEWRVYSRLYKSRSVSDLDMRSKKQAYYDALAAYRISVSDQEKVKCGLSKLYIQQAEQEEKALVSRLAGVKKEYELLKESGKYYKIVAPYDGIVKTHSDTVHAWNNAGTAAAGVHRVDRYYVYSYFQEEDMRYITPGVCGRIFNNHTGKYYDVRCFEITRDRSVYGDKVYHLVKFHVTSPVEENMRVESAVVVELPIVEKAQ